MPEQSSAIERLTQMLAALPPKPPPPPDRDTAPFEENAHIIAANHVIPMELTRTEKYVQVVFTFRFCTDITPLLPLLQMADQVFLCPLEENEHPLRCRIRLRYLTHTRDMLPF